MKISRGICPVARCHASIIHAQELRDRRGVRVTHGCEKPTNVGEAVAHSSGVNVESHRFTRAVDAYNLRLDRTWKVLGREGARQHQGKPVVGHHGTVAEVTRDHRAVVDSEQLCKIWVRRACDRLNGIAATPNRRRQQERHCQSKNERKPFHWSYLRSFGVASWRLTN